MKVLTNNGLTKLISLIKNSFIKKTDVVETEIVEIYTTSDIDDKLITKQDTIEDLDTIREGSNKGATAIQEVKTINGESIIGEGDITIQGGSGSKVTFRKWGV